MERRDFFKTMFLGLASLGIGISPVKPVLASSNGTGKIKDFPLWPTENYVHMSGNQTLQEAFDSIRKHNKQCHPSKKLGFSGIVINNVDGSFGFISMGILLGKLFSAKADLNRPVSDYAVPLPVFMEDDNYSDARKEVAKTGSGSFGVKDKKTGNIVALGACSWHYEFRDYSQPSSTWAFIYCG